jgi:hypothetical protein
VRPGAIEPRARSARATRSSRASPPRATTGSRPGTASFKESRAAPSRRKHLGAGLIDPGQVTRLIAEVDVEQPALPAEVG